MDKVNAGDEQQTTGALEQAHEPSLDNGDQMVAQELQDYLL